MPVELVPLLVGVLVARWARTGIMALRDLLGARASPRVRAGARAALVRTLLRLGPDAVNDERAGELVGTATEGVARLDAVVAR